MNVSCHKDIPDVKIIDLAPRRDARGSFMRIWDRDIFARNGLPTEWVQENRSHTAMFNTLRGLHYQRLPFAETKLVYCVAGRILDLFVDLRRGSKTFGHSGSIELDDKNPKLVLVPKGFAHGYLTLAADSIVSYKVDAPYSPESEGGLRWNDPCLGNPWAFQAPQLSEKDAAWPLLKQLPQIDLGGA